MKNLITFIAVTLLAGMLAGNLSAQQEAEYYVWVDENGVTNYSQRNPQGVDATYVGPTRAESSRRPGAVPLSEEEEAVAETDEEGGAPTDEEIDQDVAERRAAIDAQIAETRRQNCEIGRRNLAQLEAFARVRVTDANGQQRVLSDSEKASRIQEARNTIRENCTSS